VARNLVRRATAVAAVAVGAVAPGRVSAQSVLLEIRPRPGDTLHLALDQVVEITGVTRIAERDSTMTMTMSTSILARAIIVSADTLSARVVAVTDSVAVSGTGVPAPDEAHSSLRWVKGSRVEMRVFRDGSSEIVSDPAALTSELKSLVAQMPATLPRTPISPGYSWTRVVTVPVETKDGVVASASLRTTFRFDSLSKDREIAFISMRGELTRTSADSAAGRPGVEMGGTLRGSMAVDRHRGWMVDSRAVITLRSVLPPSGPRGLPVRLNWTITQRMRALDKR
jgi:hypothetical protein